MGSWWSGRLKIHSVARHPPLQKCGLPTLAWWFHAFPGSWSPKQLLCVPVALLKDGIQPDLYWGDLGFALLSLCCHLLCGVLHALLALGITAGQVCVLRYFPEVLLSRPRWKPADDGDGGGVWALRLLPGYPQCGMEDLYHCHGPGLWPPPPGGPHRPHGLLCVGAHLQDSGKSGWRNSVSGG